MEILEGLNNNCYRMDLVGGNGGLEHYEGPESRSYGRWSKHGRFPGLVIFERGLSFCSMVVAAYLKLSYPHGLRSYTQKLHGIFSVTER
jgi:hypothetical protein